MHALNVGCAWLAQQNSLEGAGWASVDGGEPFEFSSAMELVDHADLWVTSCPQNAFSQSGSANLPTLRHADFLPTPITAVAQELGLGNVPATTAQCLSEVLSRVVAMACEHSPGLAETLTGASPARNKLSDAIQVHASPSGKPIPVPADLMEAFRQMAKKATDLRAPPSSNIIVRVPVNRQEMADTVLKSTVPGETWREVGSDEFPNVLTWATGNNKNIVALVNVGEPQPGIRVLAPLLRSYAKRGRHWMALPEIVALSRFFKLRSERTFVCEDVLQATGTMRVAPPEFSPAGYASVSVGLFAEAFMHAMTTPTAPISEQNAQSLSELSVRAAWLGSVARSMMLQEAIWLSERNYAVVGYGASHVLVATKKSTLGGLRETLAKSKKLSYPTGVRETEERNRVVSTATLSHNGQEIETAMEDH